MFNAWHGIFSFISPPSVAKSPSSAGRMGITGFHVIGHFCEILAQIQLQKVDCKQHYNKICAGIYIEQLNQSKHSVLRLYNFNPVAILC